MSDQDTGKTIRLQVARASERDVGKGVARLGPEAFDALGIRQGDLIEIIGQSTTAAIALGPYPQDEWLEIIRLDGLLRTNANASMGDKVDVRAAEVKPARAITLAPAVPNVQIKGSGQGLLRALLQRPVVAGDIISTSVYRRSSDMDPGVFPEELFRSFFQQQRNFGLQEIRLQVVATKPRGIVQIVQDTEIELLPEYTEPTRPY